MAATKTDVVKIRAQRAELLAELRTLAAAPLPRTEARALLEETLAAAATWRAPTWLAALAHGEVPAPADVALFASSQQEAQGIVLVPGVSVPLPQRAGDGLEVPPRSAVVRTLTTTLTDRGRDGFLLATCGPQIVEAFVAQLDQRYDEHQWDTVAVAAPERETRRAALEERLATLALEEEQAIVRLELAGATIDRRPDVDGWALFHERVLALEAAPETKGESRELRL